MNKNNNTDSKEVKRRRRNGMVTIGVGTMAVVATAIAIPVALLNKTSGTEPGNGFVDFSQSQIDDADNPTTELAEATFGKSTARKIIENDKQIKEVVQRVVAKQIAEDPALSSSVAASNPDVSADNVDIEVKDIQIKKHEPLPTTPDKERYDVKYIMDIHQKDADKSTGTLHVTADQDHKVQEVMFVPLPETNVEPIKQTVEESSQIIEDINTNIVDEVQKLQQQKWSDKIGRKVQELVQTVTDSSFHKDLTTNEAAKSNYINEIIGIAKETKDIEDGNGGKEQAHIDKVITTQAEYDTMQAKLDELSGRMDAQIGKMAKEVIAHDFRAKITFDDGTTKTVDDDEMTYREYMRDYYLKQIKMGAVSMETTNALVLLKAMESYPVFEYEQKQLGSITVPKTVDTSAADKADEFDARKAKIEEILKQDILGKEAAKHNPDFAKDSTLEKRYLLPINGETLTFETEQAARDFYISKFGEDSYSLEILGTGEILSIPQGIENLNPKTVVTKMGKPMYVRSIAGNNQTQAVPKIYQDIFEKTWQGDVSKVDFSSIRNVLSTYMKDRYAIAKGRATVSKETEANVKLMTSILDDKLSDDVLKARLGMFDNPGSVSAFNSIITKCITPLFSNAMQIFKEDKAKVKIQLTTENGKPVYLRDSEGQIVELNSATNLPIAKVIKGADKDLLGDKNITGVYVKKIQSDIYKTITDTALKATLVDYYKRGIIPLEYTESPDGMTMQYSVEGRMLLLPLTQFGVLKTSVEFRQADKYDPTTMKFLNTNGEPYKDDPTSKGVGGAQMYEQLENYVFEESFVEWFDQLSADITEGLEEQFTKLTSADKDISVEFIYSGQGPHTFKIDYMDNPYEYDGQFFATEEEANAAKLAA